MSVKINFYKTMSGNYHVDMNQGFTKEEVLFIQKAINEALKKQKIEKDSKQDKSK